MHPSFGWQFVVNAERQQRNVDFHIVMCKKTSFTTKEAFRYQRRGRSVSNYILLGKSESMHLHASSVSAIRFSMLPAQHRVSANDHVHTISYHIVEGICQAIVGLHCCTMSTSAWIYGRYDIFLLWNPMNRPFFNVLQIRGSCFIVSLHCSMHDLNFYGAWFGACWWFTSLYIKSLHFNLA